MYMTGASLKDWHIENPPYIPVYMYHKVWISPLKDPPLPLTKKTFLPLFEMKGKSLWAELFQEIVFNYSDIN